jgi:hypothetical protein
MAYNDRGRGCLDCPRGSWCDGTTRLQLCYDGSPATCRGVEGCAAGFDREACGFCAAGFLETRTPGNAVSNPSLVCKACPGAEAGVVAGAVVGVVLLGALYLWLLTLDYHALNAQARDIAVGNAPVSACQRVWACLYRGLQRQWKLMRHHHALLNLPSRQLRGLSILYAASSLPYPAAFRDTLLGFFNGLPIPWGGKVECLKQGASWTFEDSFMLRAILPAFMIILFPYDLFTLQDGGNVNPSPEEDYTSNPGSPPLNSVAPDPAQPPPAVAPLPVPRKCNCCARLCNMPTVLTTEWPRWLVNHEAGSARGYDHHLLSAQYLGWTTDNFLQYALMALVCTVPVGGGEARNVYSPALACEASSQFRYGLIFVVCYTLAWLWFYAVPLAASFAEARLWRPVAALTAWCKYLMEAQPPWFIPAAWKAAETRRKHVEGRLYPIPPLPPFPELDRVAATFSFLFHLQVLLATCVVLAPRDALGVTGTLLCLALLELGLYAAYCYSDSRRVQPFVLRGEQCLYAVQLLLAVATHSVGVSCASQSCDPASAPWQPAGRVLTALHFSFFGLFLGYWLWLLWQLEITRRAPWALPKAQNTALEDAQQALVAVRTWAAGAVEGLRACLATPPPTPAPVRPALTVRVVTPPLVPPLPVPRSVP